MNEKETTCNNFSFGTRLHPQCRQIINNIYYFMRQEDDADEPLLRFNKVIPRLSAATGISEDAATNIINEYKKILKGEISGFSTSRPKKVKTKIEGSDEDKTILRRIILDKFVNDRAVPMKIDVFNQFKNTSKFEGSCHEILSNIGFRWKDIGTHKYLLIEDHEVRKKRLHYIRSINNYKKNGYKCIYLRDLYIHLDLDDTTKLSSKGKIKNRFAIVTAASEDGLLPSTSLVYEVTNISNNSELSSLYLNWIKNDVVKQLPVKSLIVLPESVFQCTQRIEPYTEDITREGLINWLEYHKIPFNKTDMKTYLVDIILEKKIEIEAHSFNEIFKDRNIDFLRIPLNHSDLNPVDNICECLKEYIYQSLSSYSTKTLKTVCERFFTEFPAEKWRIAWEEVETCEKYYLDVEPIVDAVSDEFIDNSQVQLDGMTHGDTSNEHSESD
ncbi:hypothetical protein HHI36_006515 [Cryptolaemus montrouzieri]|uniref:Uncharacterized protein n=1 Tax=Cryptolaemus montrouzieri TaxID=559131 RepID=A0ABD2NXN5_9CUCU